MKHCSLVLLMLVLCYNALSQKYTLSPVSIDDPGYEYVKVIGQDDNGFYLLQSNISLNTSRDRIGFRNRKYKLSYYNFSLSQLWSKKIEGKTEPENVDVITMFNGRPLVITSLWQKNENTVTYSGEVLDNKGNSVLIKSLGKISYDKSSDMEKARVITAVDNLSAALVMEEIRENDQRIHLIIFDTTITALSNSSPVINYDTKQLEITEADISNDRQVAVLALHTEKKPEGQKGKVYQYKLFILTSGGSSFNESPVSSGDKQMTEASLNMDNINHKAVVTGFYNDNESYTGTGIIFASADLDAGEPMEIKTVSIDDNARIKLIGERNSGANTGLYSYPIRKLILRSDGGAVVVAEAAYYSEYSYYDYFTNSFTRRVEYHYDNVVIMSIHTNGTIDWSAVLRKSQETIDDGGYLSSFTTVLQSDRIGLIYNSDISRNNEVMAFSVDNKGKTDQANVVKAETHITIIPHSAKQVDENTLITAAIQKKRLYLLKIEL